LDSCQALVPLFKFVLALATAVVPPTRVNLCTIWRRTSQNNKHGKNNQNNNNNNANTLISFCDYFHKLLRFLQ
jgi:hypothetical protein